MNTCNVYRFLNLFFFEVVIFLVIFFLSLFPFSYMQISTSKLLSVCGCVRHADKQRDVSVATRRGLIFCLLPRCRSRRHPSFVTVYSEGFWGQLWTDNFIWRLIWEQCCQALCKQITFLSDAGISFQDAAVSCRDQWTNAGGKEAT